MDSWGNGNKGDDERGRSGTVNGVIKSNIVIIEVIWMLKENS